MKVYVKIFVICSLVSCISGFSISSTKFPPIAPAFKSLIATIPPVLSQLKNDFINEKVYEICAFIGKIGVLLYSCLSIGLLCDSYFVPSLEFIGEYLKLSPDITGALFTPLGTAGPEVFSSILGIFVSEGNIGTGAIIGSAVFNLMIIPAACALTAIWFRGQPLKLNAMTIVRDLILYIISIIALILVIQDNKVEIVEASLLILLFILIVVFLYYNAELMDKLKTALLKIEKKACNCPELECDQNCSLIATAPTEQTPLFDSNKKKTFSIQYSEDYRDLSYEVIDMSSEGNNNFDLKLDETIDGSYTGLMYRILIAPVKFLMYITIPKASQSLFVFTFVLSICWLALLSYLTVTNVEFVSENIGISDTIAGMTLLAVANAMPDLVTSIIFVKKKGLVDMAICGAIASNRFAILIGLGFPWFVKCLVNWAVNESFFWNYIHLTSTSLPNTALVLLVAIVLLFINFRLNNWVLNKKFAFICVSIHLVFVSIAIYLEYTT